LAFSRPTSGDIDLANIRFDAPPRQKQAIIATEWQTDGQTACAGVHEKCSRRDRKERFVPCVWQTMGPSNRL